MLYNCFRAFFPSLFNKTATVTISETDIANEIELETIPIQEAKKYKYPPKNMLEGIDLKIIQNKLNHF
ncbi:hypothetical protein LEP1GSC124_2430 [Leptospira interrogans serovar Pyrogenes str. 200701872]|uniref:Uncharacterized protein n=1 Tax=Leptospira interrogans serovar Pyrogenes str. 200701872 TaxID=1193029 RepID=M7A8W6_LEPIR|nr:hypothetical protein LEP1GSC124_2430 [Leptospira interrogans serovar Pyrogenes str. 200701872]